MKSGRERIAASRLRKEKKDEPLGKDTKRHQIPNATNNNGEWIKTDLVLDATRLELVVTDFENSDFIRDIIDDDDEEKDEVDQKI